MIQLNRVEATGGFFLLLAWLNYIDRDFLVPMTLIACALHELGHVAAIRLLGGSVKGVRLTAIGAELVLAYPLGYWQEGLSALAGPGVNLLLALAFCTIPGGVTFSGLNLVLAFFNLLPLGRLDGGRAVYCTLALLAGQEAADQIRRCLDCLSTAGMMTAGLFLTIFRGNITLLLTAFWLTAVVLRQKKYGFPRNKACQRSRKKVQ